jgi:hypothetical protein
MDRLEAYKQQISLDRAVPFVTAIFDVGDMLSPLKSDGMFEISSAMHAARIVLWYLKQEQDPAKRGEILLQAAEQTVGLSLPVDFASMLEKSVQRQGDLKDFVTAADLDGLKALCVSKIQSRAESGQLPTNDFSGMLFRWKEWAGDDAPSAFCCKLVESDQGLLQFLRAFVVQATSHAMTDYVATARWYIRSSEIEAFLPFELVESRVNAVAVDSELSPEDLRALSAFKKAAERRRAGKRDDDPFARD